MESIKPNSDAALIGCLGGDALMVQRHPRSGPGPVLELLFRRMEFGDEHGERLGISGHRNGPASIGSNPTSRISVAAIFLHVCLSAQYTVLGGVAFVPVSRCTKLGDCVRQWLGSDG